MADPLELASTIQTAHINRSPSPLHDLNPSTAASAKVPVQPVTYPSKEPPSLPSTPNFSPRQLPSGRHHRASTSHTTLRPIDRHSRSTRGGVPPLPDLRFEQSYLASISKANTWQQVVWITTRDQVLLPLIQGTLWTLLLAGWRHWNTGAKFAGESVGARIRRWWWGVNNWVIPGDARGKKGSSSFAREVKEATRGAVSGMGAAERERKVGVW